MKNEWIKDYTARITQSNKSQLIVIMYELILLNIGEARQALKKEQYKEFSESIRKAQRFLQELIVVLDHKFSIAGELRRLYLFYNRSLSAVIVKRDEELLYKIEEMIRALKAAFEEVAKQDTSSPLMENAQQIYAGLTYSKKNSYDIYHDPGTNRGFTA